MAQAGIKNEKRRDCPAPSDLARICEAQENRALGDKEIVLWLVHDAEIIFWLGHEPL
jgi:hypothetical protein